MGLAPSGVAWVVAVLVGIPLSIMVVLLFVGFVTDASQDEVKKEEKTQVVPQ